MCTTILVGKNASYDGSTLMARNEDSPSGQFSAKKLVVVLPENQPRKYKSVLSSFSIDLPDNPLRYTSMPNADSKEGIWAAAGVNSANIAMTATETLTSNYRVTAADPFVKDGISEEDMVTIVLPYNPLQTVFETCIERLSKSMSLTSRALISPILIPVNIERSICSE